MKMKVKMKVKLKVKMSIQRVKSVKHAKSLSAFCTGISIMLALE